VVDTDTFGRAAMGEGLFFGRSEPRCRGVYSSDTLYWCGCSRGIRLCIRFVEVGGVSNTVVCVLRAGILDRVAAL
jgi:hypothetical protein